MCLLCLAASLASVFLSRVRGDDWPTYRHDNERSAVTSETLAFPLSQSWAFRALHAPEPAWPPPKPVPIESILELRRVHFDEVFHVVVAGDKAYFGSSADNKVYALDVATGDIEWTFRTGGPVRLAPAVWNDRVFFGSDDGFIYCLRAADGKEVWRFQAAPRDDRVLGHGKMISMWPARAGVLVDSGLAYFAAGIFPAEGVYLYAVWAEDGKLVWKNDTLAETTRSDVSPQGYMLASAEHLYVPQGRVSPAAFDKRNGNLLSKPFFGKRVGGTYALLSADRLFTGTEEILAYNPDSPRDTFAWFQGGQIVVTDDMAYVIAEGHLAALPRKTYPATSLKRRALVDRRRSLVGERDSIRWRTRQTRERLQAYQGSLAGLEKRMAELKESGSQGDAELAALKARLESQKGLVEVETKRFESYQNQLARLEKQVKDADEQMEKNWEAFGARWRRPCELSDALILAGGALLLGGAGQVMAVDSGTGETLWSSPVDGRAKGLAVASGRLFVSTDKGLIYCFGPAGSPQRGWVTQPVDPSRLAQDELADLYEAAADVVVELTGIRRGFCLVAGCATGGLAVELARRTDLRIYAVDPDPERVAAVRAVVDAAGLQGARVCVEQWPLEGIPYADYFANLIVSERTLRSGVLPGSAAELFRMLKPLGGTILLGQPDGAAGKVKPIDVQAARRWMENGGLEGGRVLTQQGVWVEVVRGPLPGAGTWTHQYADPGNSACGDDEIVQCPLGILWFGEPGPTHMVNRHARTPGPLSVGGRFFVQGEHRIMAHDAYNGVKLWERTVPGAMRTQIPSQPSNLAASLDSLFVAVGERCLRLEVESGHTKATYRLPEGSAAACNWGYVAHVDGLLYGTRTTDSRTSDLFFAVDADTEEIRWNYGAEGIRDTAISIGDGRIFLTAARVTQAQREAALGDKIARLKDLRGEDLARAKREIEAADVRLVVALDARSGEKLWERPVDLTGCGGGALSSIYHGGVLLFFGVHVDGHYWQQFFKGEFASRRITALSGDDGKPLWSRNTGHRVRPLVIGDTLHAEPWAFYLRTGEQRMRTHPVTGEPVPWRFGRYGHHCGCPVGSSSSLFFRSLTLGYYDLTKDDGTLHFGAQRPGCWINFIPAGGLLIVPEASTGCMCAFPNMCTVVLKPGERNQAWGIFSTEGSMTPVRHLAINLGAPGDRRDDRGRLWLAYPRPADSRLHRDAQNTLVLKMDLKETIESPGGYFRRNSDTTEIAGTDTPWVFTSGVQGLKRCILPLRDNDDGAAAYTVRLCFAEHDGGESGKRVFNVALQGKEVLKDLNVAGDAGGPNKAIVREFKGVRVEKGLEIDLVPSEPTPGRPPLLNAIEVTLEDR